MLSTSSWPEAATSGRTEWRGFPYARAGDVEPIQQARAGSKRANDDCTRSGARGPRGRVRERRGAGRRRRWRDDRHRDRRCGRPRRGVPPGSAHARAPRAERLITGGVGFSPTSEGSLEVDVELDGSDGGPHPAHIHPGSCADLDPTPQWPLDDVVDGRSKTTIDVGLGELTAQEYAVNVHESPENADVYVACADVRQ
jgi:hypothetical protein